MLYSVWCDANIYIYVTYAFRIPLYNDVNKIRVGNFLSNNLFEFYLIYHKNQISNINIPAASIPSQRLPMVSFFFSPFITSKYSYFDKHLAHEFFHTLVIIKKQKKKKFLKKIFFVRA